MIFLVFDLAIGYLSHRRTNKNNKFVIISSKHLNKSARFTNLRAVGGRLSFSSHPCIPDEETSLLRAS